MYHQTTTNDTEFKEEEEKETLLLGDNSSPLIDKPYTKLNANPLEYDKVPTHIIDVNETKTNIDDESKSDESDTESIHKANQSRTNVLNNIDKGDGCCKHSATIIIDLAMKTIKPFAKISAFIDFASDINLLIKTSQDPTLIWITIIMLVSILSPYLVCYAAGIRLYLNSGIFDSVTQKAAPCIYQFMSFLYLLPLGIIYYVFLDFYIDTTAILIVVPCYLYKVICSRCNQFNPEMSGVSKKIANAIGLTFMNFQGYNRMRSISQLMLESLPQIIIQTMLGTGVISLAGTNITHRDIAISISSAAFNLISQFAIMKMESMVVRDTFISYSLSCMIGRIGWIPFYKELNVEDDTYRNHTIDFSNIHSKICKLIPITIDYKFSHVTIKKLIERLANIPVDNGYNIELTLGNSCEFVDIQTMMQFLVSSQNKIRINDIDNMDWDKCCKISKKENKSISDVIHAKAANGEPLLKLAMLYHLNEVKHYDPTKESTITILSCHRKYLCAEKSGNVVCDRSRCLEWEHFKSIPLGNNKIALQTWRGEYLSVSDGSNLEAESAMITKTEQFEVLWTENRRIGFKSCYGTYLSAQSDGKISVKSNDLLENEVFYVSSVDAHPSLTIFKSLLNNDVCLMSVDAFNETIVHYLIRNCHRHKLYIEAIELFFDPQYQPLLITEVNLNLISNISHRTAIMDSIKQYVKVNQKIKVETCWNGIYQNLDALKKYPFDINTSFIKTCFAIAKSKDESDKMEKLIKNVTMKYKHIIDKEIFIDSVVGYILNLKSSQFEVLTKCLNMINTNIDDIVSLSKQNNNLLHFIVEKCTNNKDRIVRASGLIASLIDDHDQLLSEAWNRNSSNKTFVHLIFETRKSFLWYTPYNKDKKDWKSHCHALSKSLQQNIDKWFDDDIADMFVEWFFSEFKEHWWRLQKKQNYNDWVDPKNAYFVMQGRTIRNKNKETIISKIVDDADLERNDRIKQYKLCLAAHLLLKCGVNEEDDALCKKLKKCWNGFENNQTEIVENMTSDENKLEAENDEEKTAETGDEFIGLKLSEQQIDECIMVPLLDFETDRNLENEALDEKSKTYLSTFDDGVDIEDENSLINPFRHLAPHNIQPINHSSKQLLPFRFTLLMVEILAAADLVTDIHILSKFIQHGHVWWSSFTILMLLSPYYIATSSLLFLLKFGRDFFENAKCGKNLFGAIYISPLGVAYFLIIDVFFVITTIIKETISLLTCGCLDKYLECISVQYLLSALDLSTMDIAGYARLRTISQITFESLPQIILQCRILASNDKAEVGIDVNELMLSLSIALLHIMIEAVMLRYESKCCKMTFLHYCVICLNGRSSFVPFIHLFSSSDISNQNFDFNLQCRALCNQIPFKMNYLFSPSTFAKLLTSLTYLPDHWDQQEDVDHDKSSNAKIQIHGFNVADVDILSLCDLFTRTENKYVDVCLKNVDFQNALNKIPELTQQERHGMKVDPEIADNYNESLLFRFIQYKQYDAVVALLKHNVSIHKKVETVNTTILQQSIEQQSPLLFYVLLHAALNHKSSLKSNVLSERYPHSHYSEWIKHNVFERVSRFHSSTGLLHAMRLNGIPLTTKYFIDKIINKLNTVKNAKEEEKIVQYVKSMLFIIGLNVWDFKNMKNKASTQISRIYENDLSHILRQDVTIIFNKTTKEYIAINYCLLDPFLIFREYIRLCNKPLPPLDLSLYKISAKTFVALTNAIKYGKRYITTTNPAWDDVLKMDESIKRLNITYNLERYIKATKHLRESVKIKFETYKKHTHFPSNDFFNNINLGLDWPRCEHLDAITYTLPENMLALTRLCLTAFARDQNRWGTRISRIGVHVFRNNVLIKQFPIIVIDHDAHGGYYKWSGDFNIGNNKLDCNCIIGGDVLKVFAFSHAAHGHALHCKWLDFSLEYVLSEKIENESPPEKIIHHQYTKDSCDLANFRQSHLQCDRDYY